MQLALDLAPTATRPRIVLTGRLTPEQVAEHNAFIEEMREPATDRQGWVSQQSRFVGVKSGLPSYTTV